MCIRTRFNYQPSLLCKSFEIFIVFSELTTWAPAKQIFDASFYPFGNKGPRTRRRNQMQGWESVRWLVIVITLPKNRKVGSFYHKIGSCFLIETKFISKIFKKFHRQNKSQEIPRLRFSSFSRIHHF